MIDQLKQLCVKHNIRYIVTDREDMPKDTAIYSGKMKTLFASEYLSDESIRAIIQRFERSAVV